MRNIYDGKIPGARLAAVCDIDPEKCEKAAAALDGVAVFGDYKEMLASVVERLEKLEK